jgi:hypothetical protein
VPYDYDYPLALEPRYSRAAIAAIWFAAAFCVVCGALAIASALGLLGNAKDAPMLGLMVLAAAFSLDFSLCSIVCFFGCGPKQTTTSDSSTHSV